jgi:hypothetical protein
MGIIYKIRYDYLWLQVTLQYALWDQWKEAPEGDLRRAVNAAHLTAAVLASRALPLAALKAVRRGGGAMRIAGLGLACGGEDDSGTGFGVFGEEKMVVL